MKRQFTALALLAVTTPLTAQWLTLPTPGIPRTADGAPDLSAPAPRTPEGHPDFSGLWFPLGTSGDLLDPNRAHEWARALMAEREASFFAGDPRFQCLPSGPAYLTLSSALQGMRRIVQSPDVIAMLYADLSHRQIFMDGRELEPDPLPTWMGYSVGRWEGDTMIVESNGYNDRTWLHTRGLPHTERLRITERYQRTDFGNIRIDVTYEDAGTFDPPLTATIDMRLAADDEMLESVCNEASEERNHWGGEISQAEDKAIEVDPEILARYVGSYEGYWLQRLIKVDVTLEDGELFLLRTPPYTRNANTESEKSRLIPLSETAFECPCGVAFIFLGEEGEIATAVDEVHVSGAWTFPRVP